ncbi:outer membrane beta-barrel protein, partial [Methylacidimicrobium tartarophylax]|uniref:outer membrane beta-barrel protein n=1 Tax=Methylacidimicrobium tartarophylax TaxID=1041768 RepID=UPI0011591F60
AADAAESAPPPSEQAAPAGTAEPAAAEAPANAAPAAVTSAPEASAPTGSNEPAGEQGVKEALAPSAKEALGPKTGLYFGIFGGAAFGMSNGVGALDSPPLFSAGGRAAVGTAAVGGIQVGYNFRSIALDSAKSYWLQPAAQFEAFYLGQATESGSLTGGVAGKPGISTNQFGSNLNMGLFLVDGVAKFVTPIGLVPYIGGGIGGAYLASSGTSFVGPSGADLLATGSYAQGAFAGQGLVGLQYNLSEHWSLFAEYKILYIKETQFSYLMTSGNTMLIKYPEYYNIAIAGLRFNF